MDCKIPTLGSVGSYSVLQYIPTLGSVGSYWEILLSREKALEVRKNTDGGVPPVQELQRNKSPEG